MVHIDSAYVSLIRIGILVYAYVFVNTDSRVAYKTMFTRLFTVLEQVSRQNIKFPYIHHTQRGIRTISLDMCKKQAGGMCSICHAYVINILIFSRARGLLCIT